MNKLLVIQRTLPGAPNDGQFISYDFDMLNDSLGFVKVNVLDASSSPYENFDGHISISQAGILKSILSEDFNVIAVPATYGPSPLSYDGIQLAMHIRLSPELLEKRHVPIILMGFEELDQLAQLGCPYLSFFATPQVYYIEESFEGLHSFFTNEWQFLKPINDQNLVASLAQYPIAPPPHLESSHSLANEWGALELDQLTANVLSGQPEWIENNLYIKYLKVKLGYASRDSDTLKLSKVLSKAKPFNPNSKPKILYIDDEYSKGWEQTLKAIFVEAQIEFDCVKELKKGQSHKEVLRLIEEKIKSDDWNLILLDIRLTEQDQQEDNSVNFSGFEALKIIKQHNPILPVILFTASTKAKILDSFAEHGADGFYIKHSPNTSRTPETVRNDVTALFVLVKICLQKFALLAPYWEGICKIEDSNLIREKNVGSSNGTCFGERINERLRMFIGLLKKTYSQTVFDQAAFLYDEQETAFLTLWSCLNEISECYFTKSQPVCNHLLNWSGNQISDPNGHPITRNPNGRPLTYRNTKTDKHFRWELDGALFLEYKYWAKYDKNNNLVTNSSGDWYFTDFERISAFELVQGNYIDSTPKKRDLDYQKEIRMQIAFILIKKFSTGNNESDPIVKLFEDSRKLRNHLYLVHGDDTNTDYTKTIRQSGVKVTNKNLQDLFKLIYFLLKGTVPAT